jgi:hypothetical protein
LDSASVSRLRNRVGAFFADGVRFVFRMADGTPSLTLPL